MWIDALAAAGQLGRRSIQICRTAIFIGLGHGAVAAAPSRTHVLQPNADCRFHPFGVEALDTGGGTVLPLRAVFGLPRASEVRNARI